MTTATAVRFGLSSGSLPDATARELATAVRDAGGSVADVRSGKRHRWEVGGAAAGIATIQAGGVRVAYVGVGHRLGEAAEPRAVPPIPAVPAGLPVKVFCAARPDVPRLHEQVGQLRRRGHEVWVETHRGGPAPDLLADLAAVAGFGLVVDNLGVAATAGDRPVHWSAVAPLTHAVQIKGFDTTWHHRSLSGPDLALLDRLWELGAPLEAVTVETRAGTARSDLRLLVARYRGAGE